MINVCVNDSQEEGGIREKQNILTKQWKSVFKTALSQNDTKDLEDFLKKSCVGIEFMVLENNCTVLYLACIKGALNCVRFLVEQKRMNVDGLINREQQTLPPLFGAAGKGHVQIVEYLLLKGADPHILCETHLGLSPLHIACEKNHLEIVRTLLSAGVNVNIRSGKDRLTPIMSAANCGNLSIVQHLLEFGANLSSQSALGNTALILALDRGRMTVASFLIQHISQCNTSKNPSDWESLDVQGQGGFAALHHACCGSDDKPYISLTKALLISGASINLKSDAELTPLHQAAAKSNYQIVKTLLSFGANVNAQDAYHNTPLRICCSNSSIFATLDSFKQTIQILLDDGANINAATISNTTGLHSVVKSGNIDAIQFLLAHGADPTIRTTKGLYPADLTSDVYIKEMLESYITYTIQPPPPPHKSTQPQPPQPSQPPQLIDTTDNKEQIENVEKIN